MRLIGPWRCVSKATTSNRSSVFHFSSSLMSFQGATKSVAKKAIETVRLLVVSRESAVLRPLWSMGESNSWQLESAASGWGAMERVQSGVTPDLLLLDLPRGDTDGFHI